MLEISSGIDNPGNLRPELSLCLFIAWSIVFVALLKGVKSFGKVISMLNTFMNKQLHRFCCLVLRPSTSLHSSPMSF